MLSLRPQLHDLVGSTASRTLAQLREWDLQPGEHSIQVGVALDPSATQARRLLATTLIDMLMRLDPLVGLVVVDAPTLNDVALASELGLRIPLVVEDGPADVDLSIGVGTTTSPHDLVVDGSGWVAVLGDRAEVDDDGNPIGALAAAALGCAEVFKIALGRAFPDVAGRLDLTPWWGAFSLFSYGNDGASPAITPMTIDTTLVGLGGVGAGFLRAMAGLGPLVSGSLRLVDEDHLTTHNLNRVSYATVDAAVSELPKVVEAATWLRGSCPNLTVTDHQEPFDRYRRHVSARREDRRYDVVVTGLDSDEARWEVQRDLPRILIDGATGKDMVARVERVEFGRYGCLGCTRRSAPVEAPVDCDAPPDEHAPSLSFVSAYPGILAAGEVIKEALGLGGLRGQFDHMFRYGPNPERVAMLRMRADCQVQCGRASKIDQYRRKYPNEAFLV
jgi:molybdopterin/thiamine biosynthesis adenylyltransferase